MKKIIFIALIFFCKIIHSQDYSNKGKEFWIAYSAHVDATNSLMGIYITSDQNASGNISVGNNNIPFTVIANQVTKKILGTSGPVDGTNANVYLDMEDGIKQNAGIKITSNVPIVVYAHIIRSARSAATLVLPTQVLGTEYIVPGYPSVGNGNGGGPTGERPVFAVVATQNNTTIEFTTTTNSVNGTKLANQTYQITLANAGDCYQFQGTARTDISGTVVKSISTSTAGCKPIAVFAGATWTAFDCTGASGGDNLYQELFPVRSWGKQFITSPLSFRPSDIFRIYVKDPTTRVSYIENGQSTLLNLSQLRTGNFYELKTNNPLYIEADKPISVAQFMTSLTCKSGCQNGQGFATKSCAADPEMIILNPVEQTLKDITFFSAHQSSFTGFSNITNVENHYVNVIIDKKYKNSVRIDNAIPTGTFIDIVGTNYSYLQEDLTNSSATRPVHNIKADTGFSAIVYGTGNVESYGYNGGTNIVDLYQYLSLKNEYATVNFPLTCVNTPFNFSITLPYQPLKLNWDFGGTSAITPNINIINNNPVFDSSFVKDGRTLYVYKLPTKYSFNQTGTYSIKVLVNNPTSDGCNGEQEINYDVQVLNKPNPASFNITSNGCINTPVIFNNTNANNFVRPIVKYFWDFDDGTIDSVINPVKTFLTSDTFNIKHRIITDIGCFADTIKPIILTNQPTAKFIVDTNVCLNSNVFVRDSSYNTNGSVISKWYWFDGVSKRDTLFNNLGITYNYFDVGRKPIVLFVESNSGCRSLMFEKDVWVRFVPNVDFEMPSAICLPNGSATFINKSNINLDTSNLTHKWYFGNNDSSTLKNGTTNYSSIGNYNVKLISSSIYGCKAERTKVFNNIFNKPTAYFSSKSEICLRDTTVITDSSTANSGVLNKWTYLINNTTINLQNPTFIYGSSTLDTIKLVVENDKGCVSDTFKKTITINPLPSSNFFINSVTCEKQQITIVDTSKANAGNLISWNFNMGNGSTKSFNNNLNSFNFIYDTIGLYNIRSQVTNSKGCVSDSSSIVSIYVNPKPKVNFSTPEVCLNDAFAKFYDSSNILFPNSNQLFYSWNFGDKNASITNPNFSNNQNPIHTYSDTGIYTVKLIVTSNNGCVDSSQKSFFVNGATPKSIFTVLNSNNLCSNDSVRIRNNSIVDFGNITKLEIFWDTANNFNHKIVDENPTNNKIYSTLYSKFSLPTTKEIYIKVIAYSGETCKDSLTQKITLVQAPTVEFLPLNSICKDANARLLTEAKEINNLSGFASFSGTGIINRNTGLFSPSTLSPNNHYVIKYVFTTNNFGCKDSAQQSIFVIPSPIANFTVNNPLCEKNNVFFINTSSTQSGKIITSIWNFGNNDSIIKNDTFITNYIYPNANNYNVSLRIITDSGCISSTSQNIIINALPKVDFSFSENICLPQGRTEFKDLSTVNTLNRPLSYKWFFNDGLNSTSSTLENPIHFYTLLDTPKPKVKLIVTTTNGCIDSTIKILNTLLPQPKARFKVLPDSVVCISTLTQLNTLTFIDESNGITSNIKNWYWKFGNDTRNTKNVSYNFYDSGLINVQLVIQNNQDCYSDTTIKKIKVNTYPKINLPNNLNFLQGGLLTITPLSFYAKKPSFVWSVNNNDIVNENVLNAQVYPNDNKRFTLKVIGEGNCVSEDTVYVTVLKMPIIPNAFSPNGDRINDTWEIGNLESYPGSSVQVFDRFGKIVYQSNFGYTKPWNGKLLNTGADLPTGTYYYLINPKNGRNTLSGYVTLFR